MSQAAMVTHDVEVDVLPRGHEVALGAIASLATSLASGRGWRMSLTSGRRRRMPLAPGRRRRRAAPLAGLGLHVTLQITGPSLREVVPGGFSPWTKTISIVAGSIKKVDGRNWKHRSSTKAPCHPCVTYASSSKFVHWR